MVAVEGEHPCRPEETQRSEPATYVGQRVPPVGQMREKEKKGKGDSMTFIAEEIRAAREDSDAWQWLLFRPAVFGSSWIQFDLLV